MFEQNTQGSLRGTIDVYLCVVSLVTSALSVICLVYTREQVLCQVKLGIISSRLARGTFAMRVPLSCKLRMSSKIQLVLTFCIEFRKFAISDVHRTSLDAVKLVRGLHEVFCFWRGSPIHASVSCWFFQAANFSHSDTFSARPTAGDYKSERWGCFTAQFVLWVHHFTHSR